MAAAEYEIIGHHLLEIISTAQAERRNIGVIRGTTFFAMLGIPAFVYLKAPELITSDLSPVLDFAKNAAITGGFSLLMKKGIDLNVEFEHYMATQTRISQRAEELLDNYQHGEVSNTTIYKDVDYNSLRKEEQEDIDRQVENKEFKYDFPTKHARYIFRFATITAALALAINGIYNEDKIRKDFNERVEPIMAWAEENIPDYLEMLSVKKSEKEKQPHSPKTSPHP